MSPSDGLIIDGQEKRLELRMDHLDIEEENKEEHDSEDEEIFFDANEELIIDEI